MLFSALKDPLFAVEGSRCRLVASQDAESKWQLIVQP